ncbi:hypothetical protein BC351_10490 [Paenibacillus ferrarius]|uniref:Uncharacterized protein n=1 Tax=Paenibacillus ferrarius TaxID=1469647 RepID=A0A1V4H8Y3_9BACL|nr:hypothetical protein [Paenibacillus ferrarius]OPH47611.1 hypothetical protein BC351_10490 [Paenibacillus ferrarius]
MKDTLLALGIKKRNKQINMSWQEIADQSDGLFTSGENFRCWVKEQLRKKGELKSKGVVVEKATLPNYKETVEINKDGSHTSDKLLTMSAEQCKDVEYLLKAHGYDTKAWELVSARNNIWNVYSKVDGVQTLYSSKISVKPRKEVLSLEYIREVFDEMSSNYKLPTFNPVRYNADGKMLEVNISDLHLGKIADLSTSNDTYNHEIARNRFFHVINDVITRTSHYKFEKILFIYSQDFFHHEGLSTSTTSGTKMETDLRWNELFKMGVQMLVEAIDILSQVAPVETIYIESNHDRQISYYAIEYLYAWFRNNPNVTVDNSPLSRKYIEFGKNLIGFAHGHNEKKRLAFLMPTEAKEAWSRTEYREFHLGHLHSEQSVTEQNGIIVRHISSVTGTDTWHHSQGFVGSQKKAQSFVYDRDLGLLDVLHINV